MRVGSLLLCGLVLGAATGCIFTDPINVPPEVTIEGPDKVRRGAPTPFTARVVDATEGPVELSWATSAACPQSLAAADEARRTGTVPGAETATVKQVDRSPFCLSVIARDALGARTLATKMLDVITWTVALRAPPILHRGEPVAFTAEVTGEAGGPTSPRFTWFKVAGDCPIRASQAAAGEPLCRGVGGPRCEIVVAGSQPFCVAVVVTDTFGMEELSTHAVAAQSIANRAPTARIQIKDVVAGPLALSVQAQPFELFSQVRLTAAGSVDPDGDSLEHTWSIRRPDGRVETPGPCSGGKTGEEICFVADATGTFRADLKVSDGTAEVGAAPLEIAVADRPPCLARTDPPFPDVPVVVAAYDERRTFRIEEVNDDGDPLPARDGRTSQGAFVWFTREPGETEFRRRGSNTDSYVLDAFTRRPGDTLEVQVMYRDRVDLPVETRDHSACKSTPTCQTRPAGPGQATCYQKVTWTVKYLR